MCQLSVEKETEGVSIIPGQDVKYDCEIESRKEGGGQTWRCKEDNIEIKCQSET